MKITQISSGELRIPAEKGGDIDAYILSISKQLSMIGHNITILDRKYSADDQNFEYIDGVRVVRLAAKRFGTPNFTLNFVLNQIFFIFQARKYLANNDFDAISLHYSVSGTILAVTCPRLRNKLLYTSHGNRRLKQKLTFQDKIALILENYLVKRVRRVVVLNNQIKKRVILTAKVNPGKVVVIPLGIDTSDFSPSGDVRWKPGCEGKALVLFVGRIHADKGVDYLIKAANLVVNEFGYKNVQFLLVGPIGEFGPKAKASSPYLVNIMRLVEDYGLKEYVKLTGPVPLDDLKKLYRACDIFVLPSLTEAMPAAPLEAMACGKPVIGTKVGGILMEIVDGQSGYLVETADERQLAARIKYLVGNPSEAKRMGAYGRKMAVEKFDTSKIAERLLQVYQS